MNKLVVALFLCSFVARGQVNMPAKPAPEKAFIEVTGTASKEVTPDRIFVAITLQQQSTDRTGITIQKQEEELKKAVLNNGLDLKLLTLSDAGFELIAHKRKETAQEVKREFILQLTTAAQVAKVAQALQAAGIRELSIARVEYANMESLQKEIRIAALKAARDKADYLLQAIGEQLDKPLAIQEVNDSYFSRPSSSNFLLSNSASVSEEEDPEVGFSKIKVKFSYSVKYSIK